MYDTLITNGHLLTMSGDGAGFIEDGAIAIDGRHIVAVGARSDLEERDTPRHRIDARGGLIMPGLVDVHLHSAATAARGLAQEVSAWMGSAYGPLIRHVPDEDAPLWSMVALMEGVANGTTCFGDYDYPMDAIAKSHVQMGNRAVVCQGVTEIDWTQRERWIEQGWQPGQPALLDSAFGVQKLDEEIAVWNLWHGQDDGRISVIFAPLAADMLSEPMLLRCQEEARKRNSLIHIHVAQDPRENAATMARANLRSIPYLDSIGLLAPDTIAVHLSTATDDEIALVAARGARMACCTNSIGIIDGVVPPARQFRELGGAVGLGSDQAAGNNTHNMFAEMRSTAMFAKIKAEDPTVLPAWQVLRMATIDGAKVLGVDDRIGTLEPGKEADLIVIDLDRPPMMPAILTPVRNIVPNLVYAETGRNVWLSMVAGKVIFQDGSFANLDEQAIARAVHDAARRFEARVTADPVSATLPITELTSMGLI